MDGNASMRSRLGRRRRKVNSFYCISGFFMGIQWKETIFCIKVKKGIKRKVKLCLLQTSIPYGRIKL